MASAEATARAYSHPAYAASLCEFGFPRGLPRCGGSVLEREIGGTDDRDLIGPYPLFACADWSGLADDVDELGDAMVSLVLVVDPFADVELSELRRVFPDRVQPFKRHFICDLHQPLDLSGNHRRNIRRALGSVEVEVCDDPLRYLDDWMRLYAELVTRHGLVGIRAFSRESFRRQFGVPGLIALRAARDGRTVAMRLLFENAPYAYDHLAVQSRQGDEACASYALLAMALDHLRERGVRWLDLGGVPGAGSSFDGLAYFKRGWATGERTARLCGRIFDRSAYARLAGRRPAAADWFPQYRAGERDLAQAPQGARERRRSA